MFSKTVYSLGALAFMASTQAHMVMNTPLPYGFPTLQTHPIDGAGYNFPCQTGMRTDAFEPSGPPSPMTVGQDNLLNFTGSAAHGGGSCQLSVTYDYPPPADKSKWKVIHSFIGSCPTAFNGNVDAAVTPFASNDKYGRPDGVHCIGDDQGNCVRSFDFQIPKGMKNGDATLAWTWLNKIGNREFYMNCAPITISGGSDDDTFFNSLPELFVANIPGECTTDSKGGVVGYPNPGAFVTNGEPITPGAQGHCPAAGSSSGGSGSSSASAAAPSSYATPSPAAASSPAAGLSAGVSVGLNLGLQQNGKASPTAAAAPSTTLLTTTAASAPSSSAAAQSYPTAAPAPVSINTSSSSNGACSGGKISCPVPGAIICVGESQFGLCNIDYCAVPEALAAGTTCSSGVISKRDVARRSSGRIHRRGAGHVHKHSF